MRFIALALVVLSALLFFNCATTGSYPATKRPYWGDSTKVVREIEKARLGVDSTPEGNGSYAVLSYKDSYLHSDCTLSYFFKHDSLYFFSYLCSNPRWDAKELARRCHSILDDRFGGSRLEKIGENEYSSWKAQDAYIYFSLQQVKIDGDFAASYLANITYSKFSVQKSPFLADFLQNRYAKSWQYY